MTVTESLRFVQRLEAQLDELLDRIDVVICPPYTALWPVSKALRESRLSLGAQDVAPTDDLARTGQVSAGLLADVGCHWVMLGHWEIRRFLGDDDGVVNRKVHQALRAGLAPILLVGEAAGQEQPVEVALRKQLTTVLDGCKARQVAAMAFVYEPEGAIGAALPASPDQVATGCAIIRDWLGQEWGHATAQDARIIYGGSVAPEHAADLLSSTDVDGLGASRRGRDPESFADIVRRIARAKGMD